MKASRRRYLRPRPRAWWDTAIKNSCKNSSVVSLVKIDTNRKIQPLNQAPKIGYETSIGALDAIPYACSICGVQLIFNKKRWVPDDLCLKCYREFGQQRNEPWLKDLFKRERSRRIKLLRYRKRGIDYQPISYEEYLLASEEPTYG